MMILSKIHLRTWTSKIVKVLQWINVPQDKCQIKDMVSMKTYQLIKPLRAKPLFKKVFSTLVQLNMLTINWRKMFGVKKAEQKYKDQVSKVIISYVGGDVTCIWK